MKYEFKKLFSSKLMWAVLMLTLGYMVFLPLREVWGSMKTTRRSADTYQAVLDDVRKNGITIGELTQMQNEIYQSGLGGNSSYKPKYGKNAVDDLVAIDRAISLIGYCQSSFEQNRRELVKGMIYQNITEKKNPRPDSSLISTNEKAIELYNRRTSLQLKSTGVSADTQYAIFNYSMWEYVMIALCVLMTVRLYSCEYAKGAFRLVNTGRRTLQSLFFKKFLTVWITAVTTLIVQSAFELAAAKAVFGLKNLSLPLQQIQMFEYCPYAVSIAQFYLIKLALRVLSYTALISLCALVTTLVKKPLLSSALLLPLCAGGLLANMVLFVRINNHQDTRAAVLKTYDALRIALPQSLLNVKEYLKKFDYFSLFGKPVSRLAACITIAAALCALCLALGYKSSGKIRRKA